MAKLVSGRQLGPYEILSLLGPGGMGEVYKARETRLNRFVAIKVLPDDVAARPEAKQRFEREAQAIAALNDAHICVLYDFGHHEGIDCVVMEYLEGQTIAECLTKGPLQLPVVSPDGRKLAFTARDAVGKVQLWVQTMDSVSARAIPGTESLSRPFWSHSSRSFGFPTNPRRFPSRPQKRPYLRVDLVGNVFLQVVASGQAFARNV